MSSAELQAGREGRALRPGYSQEFPDHVPGDELDGLWLVFQAQGSESLPNGMLILKEHDGAVALGLRLWGQEGQLRSWSAHILWPVPTSSRADFPSFFHPIQWQRRLEGAQITGLPRVSRAWCSVLESGLHAFLPTSSSENKASFPCLVQILLDGWGGELLKPSGMKIWGLYFLLPP